MIDLLSTEIYNNPTTLKGKIIELLLDENPSLENIVENANSENKFITALKDWIYPQIRKNERSLLFYKHKISGFRVLKEMSWKDVAAIRILDYIDHHNQELEDLNQGGKKIKNKTLSYLFFSLKIKDKSISLDFLLDFLYLFRQLNGTLKFNIPTKEKIDLWMHRHPSGLDNEIIEIRKQNKKRIITLLIKKIDAGIINHKKYTFEKNSTFEQKYTLMEKWWKDRIFHLQFAVRNPDLLNELLDFSLKPKSLEVMYKAAEKGIPFFVNPYYLSLLNTEEPDFAPKSDMAIRQYVLYSNELINEFGNIVAWEKEDKVEKGKPNAAGWLLPSHDSVHRRYPEVAILIPATVGRACAGLCVSCQRMYDFQRGHLNFNLDKLRPNEVWAERLERYLKYFENDAQLRDILITGGDAFMSTDKSLKQVLDAVYRMAVRKKEANKNRSSGQKYAEMQRLRLGTRIFAYLPQRVTSNLIDILSEFKQKAAQIGFKQFVVQTHFESAMEITPESREAVRKIQSSGWIITNQLVLTAAASRRGHAAKLRKVLNDIGIVPYYTFSVKGYQENKVNFATNARAVQEQREEKYIGLLTKKIDEKFSRLPEDAENIVTNLEKIRQEADLEFIATDRNVLNLPGVGKSLSYRVIGITKEGRRILQFDHDHTRTHSPIIEKMGRVSIIESKSIYEFLRQLESFGENPQEYETIWGFSVSQTEYRSAIYDYPDYEFTITNEFTNLVI